MVHTPMLELASLLSRHARYRGDATAVVFQEHKDRLNAAPRAEALREPYWAGSGRKI